MIDEYCPIRNDGNCRCMGKSCAWWNEEMKMCCIKSAAIAVAGKKNGGSSPTAQAYYIPPSSYCQTSAVSDKIIDDSYQLTRDIPIAPVLRERG